MNFCPQNPLWRILAKNRENDFFDFSIFRPICPIFVFCKREKLCLYNFHPNPGNWVHISRSRGKNGFFEVTCRFWPLFGNSICGFFAEISTRVEISTVKFWGKKLMTLVHLPYKYLSHTTITFEDIAKKDVVRFFFDLTVRCTYFRKRLKRSYARGDVLRKLSIFFFFLKKLLGGRKKKMLKRILRYILKL